MSDNQPVRWQESIGHNQWPDMLNKILEHFLKIKKEYIKRLYRSQFQALLFPIHMRTLEEILKVIKSEPPMQENSCRQILAMGLP